MVNQRMIKTALLTVVGLSVVMVVTSSLVHPQITPDEVPSFGDRSLYDTAILRTVFLDFERDSWERDLEAYYHTDVEVPARLTMDGKVYEGVGVSFRGNTSYREVPRGQKRSLNLSIDFKDDEQRLLGYRSLNLLNSNQDPTFLRSYLYLYVSRQYIAAPKANFVRVVINGEDWGVYVNIQQVNGDFMKETFDSRKGARWKVSGSGRGMRGGLAYLGENPLAYWSLYDIKSDDVEESWDALINLTRVLNGTPFDQLPAAIEPILDVDATLRFLALDKAFQNNDGYWTKGGDYYVVMNKDGVFRPVPWDANETWREIEGGRGGSFAYRAQLDPFDGANDTDKALLYRLLRVESYQQRYLAYLRDIAENWLDWDRLAPVIEEAHRVIGDAVEADDRKLYSTDSFLSGVFRDSAAGYGRSSPPSMSLMSFATERREYLLNYPAVREAPPLPK